MVSFKLRELFILTYLAILVGAMYLLPHPYSADYARAMSIINMAHSSLLLFGSYGFCHIRYYSNSGLSLAHLFSSSVGYRLSAVYRTSKRH